jgi:hypothetical protein
VTHYALGGFAEGIENVIITPLADVNLQTLRQSGPRIRPICSRMSGPSSCPARCLLSRLDALRQVDGLVEIPGDHKSLPLVCPHFTDFPLGGGGRELSRNAGQQQGDGSHSWSGGGHRKSEVRWPSNPLQVGWCVRHGVSLIVCDEDSLTASESLGNERIVPRLRISFQTVLIDRHAD